MRFEGQVVLVTGAGRGQGRSHAVAFAEEGADVIAIDACVDMPSVRYPMSGCNDLEETRSLVEQAGRRCLECVADVRSQSQLDEAVRKGVGEFGRLDVVIANAGVFTMANSSWEMDEETWSTTLDINLSGAWRTCKAAIPRLLAGKRGGSIVLVASANGYRAEAGHPSYNASKLGLVALMRSLAAELGRHNIRVNTVHPTAVKTDIMWNDTIIDLFLPGKTVETVDEGQWWDALKFLHLLPIGALESSDVSEVIKFLASKEGRFITATEVPIDAGYIMKINESADSSTVE